MEVEKVEHAAGGKGFILKRQLLSATELRGDVGMFAEITLKPGCSLGFHAHTDNAEAYYILSGEGEYDDNGVIRTVKQKRYRLSFHCVDHEQLNNVYRINTSSSMNMMN